MKIKISPKRVVNTLLLSILLLGIANLLGLVMNTRGGLPGRVVHRLFDLNTEANIPSLFSTLLLLCCFALLLFIHYTLPRITKRGWHWYIMSLVFLYLAIDENASLHEGLMVIFRKYFDLKGFFYYSWIIPYTAVGLGMGLFFIPFFRKLPGQVLLNFAFAALIYLGGAVGMEMIGGRHDYLYGRSNMMYAFYYSLEETLEMLGLTVFIGALLQYVVTECPVKAMRIHVENSPGR